MYSRSFSQLELERIPVDGWAQGTIPVRPISQITIGKPNSSELIPLLSRLSKQTICSGG